MSHSPVEISARMRTRELFVQHTGLAEQALPLPMPMTLMGEQFTPKRPVTSERTMPRRPRRKLADAEFAWMNPSR